MAVYFNLIKTVASKFNSKGAKLLNRAVGLTPDEAVKMGIHVPKGTTSVDVSRVGREFNPDKHYTDIFTFRNNDEDLVTQYIRKIDGDNVVETKRQIQRLAEIDVDLVEDGSEVMNIYGKKIRTTVRENGPIKNVTDETFTITEDQVPTLTHSKRTISPNNESLLIEEKQNGKVRKYLFNQYETDRFAPGDFSLKESEASSDALKEIAENNFLLPYVSSSSRFPRRITQAAIEDANFIVDPKVQIYRKASSTYGYYSHDGKVNINIKTKQGLRQPRESIVDTAGHEVEHAIWDEKSCNYHMSKTGMFPDMEGWFTPEEIATIKKYELAIDNYVPPEVDKKAYWENFAEVTARKGGKRALDKYFALEDAITKEFPFTHPAQFHPIEEVDDMAWFNTLLRK